MPRSYVKVAMSPGVRRPGASGNGRLAPGKVKPIYSGKKPGPLPTMRTTMPSAAARRGIPRPRS